MCKRILILLKQSYTYGAPEQGPAKAGLLNSADFLAGGLEVAFDLDVKVVVCTDANDIDREVFNYKPDLCILEALWYTPEKLLEVQQLHRGVVFVVRINSKIPFLALEGMSVGWMKQYLTNAKSAKLDNLILSTNNFYCTRDLNAASIPNVYLPNLYPAVPEKAETIINKISEEARLALDMPLDLGKKTLNVGCFGAIRPLKNQLIQAVAAIEYANNNGLTLLFHINSSRVEQQGSEPLKNLRSLFEGGPHHLVEHGWVGHQEFLDVLREMDVCLQVSFTESFNIVTADTISQYVPVVVSPDIDWVPPICRADPNDATAIATTLGYVLGHNALVIRRTVKALNTYTRKGTKEWFNFLYPDIHHAEQVKV